MTAILERAELGLDDRAADVIFRDARTAYAYDDTPVTDEQLSQIYERFRWAPTGLNSQPLRIVFVRSAEARARLLPHIAEGNRRKAESAPVIAILAVDTAFHRHLPRLTPHAPHAWERFEIDADAREETARFNATLQIGYFILAVRSTGLDAGPLGGIDKAGIDAEFFAGTPLRTLLAVNIGTVAVEGVRPRAPRLRMDEAVRTL